MPKQSLGMKAITSLGMKTSPEHSRVWSRIREGPIIELKRMKHHKARVLTCPHGQTSRLEKWVKMQNASQMEDSPYLEKVSYGEAQRVIKLNSLTLTIQALFPQ